MGVLGGPRGGPKTPLFGGSPGGVPRGGPGGAPGGPPGRGREISAPPDFAQKFIPGRILYHLCVPTGRVIKYPRKCALFCPPGGPPGTPPGGVPGPPFWGPKKAPKTPLFRGSQGPPGAGDFGAPDTPSPGDVPSPRTPWLREPSLCRLGALRARRTGGSGKKNRRLGASLKLPCEGLRQLAYATQLSLTRGDPLRGYNLRPVGLDCRQPSAILLTWDYATLRGDTRCRARHVSSLREDVIVRLAADATAVSPVTSRLTNL